MPDDSITRRYAIEAFDESLNLKWRHDGTFTSEMLVENGITSLVAAEPKIAGNTNDGNGIVVSVGRQVLVLSPTDGTVTEEFSFDQTVVEAAPSPESTDDPDDPGFITIACTNGSISCKNLLEGAQDAIGDGTRLSLPFPIRWAQVVRDNDYEMIIAIPANAEDRIVSYRTNWTRGQDTSSGYSLDELITMANQVLAEGGRT